MEYNCVYHPHKRALSFCHSCGKYLCEDCLNEGPLHYYCSANSCVEKYDQEVDYHNNPRFCPKCVSETTEESNNGITSTNIIVETMLDILSPGINELNRTPYLEIDDCDICGSIIMATPNNTYYRVIWLNEGKTQYISRKVKVDYL